MKEIKVTVDGRNEGAFLRKVDSINQKLARYHYPQIVCEEINREVSRNYDTNALECTIYYNVKSEFEKTNLMDIDVTFEGVVELLQLGRDDTKIFDIENESVGNILFKTHCVCDKCKKDIARGKYLVFSKTNDVKTRDDLVILGTTCAKAYFPFNIENFLSGFDTYVESLMEYDEDSCGIYSMASRNAQLSDIAYAVDVMTNGLTKPYRKESNYERGTLQEVRDFYESLFSNSSRDKEFVEKITSEQTESVDSKEMISIARDYYNRHSKDNDFSFNCNQFLKYDDIDKRYFGRVASALIFGNLNATKEKETIETNSATTSYVMEEKEKFQNLELNFDKVISFETQYGTTSMMRFLDNEGHILVWYTQKSTKEISPSARPLNKGDKVYLNGTCKGHKEYRGEKQTLITRCKSAVEPKFVPTAEELAMEEENRKLRESEEKAIFDFFKTMDGE